ncbi:hypothetical protein HYH03_001159 [Edaphochlamys debaryana]|uniref:Guanylate cyclase domain-containing protein n=1 Tax=Edaphochlamys debaryana TaxID=47281 RepID=A0A836C6X1_9CHLO|nr:hypothetical protein HYH03_001159 [Edaphochlamys debaryana]|eukprot:KAG2501369.1 hypothetical protein HYH03_001159 [Edaphochlamys debaryana]
MTGPVAPWSEPEEQASPGARASADCDRVSSSHDEGDVESPEYGPGAHPGPLEPDADAMVDETLAHVESAGRPHDWWWALNSRRRQMAYAVFGRSRCAAMDAALTGTPWLFVTVVITLYSLYAVDVCDVAAGSPTARTVVSALLLAAFIIFGVELILNTVFTEKYFLSFFFWVDLVGTASLILDIQWIAAALFNSTEDNALQITRAGRAARIGSQIGRITRVLRMLRLFRAMRLLKVLQIRRRQKEGMEAHGLGNGPIRPTVLGELLAEATTRKCVIIILFVLIVSTFLESTPPDAADYSRIQLLTYGQMTPEAFVDNAPYPVLKLQYVDSSLNGSVINFLNYTRSNMRPIYQLRTEVECIQYSGPNETACPYPDPWSTVWYDVTSEAQLNAGFNIILTTVIIACLGLSAYFFGKDATMYVIVPIETMLKYLRRMIMVGDNDAESDVNHRKPPETDLLANYVSRLVTEIDNARWKAEEEARISDTLLNSMVPPRIARQLKELRWWEAGPEQRAQTIADSFPNATVLFTDLVGFTSISSRISPEDAMRHLNNMYTVFDDIIEKYGLYKVETIGDSYMLVGGAPDERIDHAERVAAAALEIRACVPLLQEISGEPGINVRIGMHSGAVVAGVVGFKNPRWHLFGDTCNTASRMESTGIAGEIQLSSTTYELIRERFSCKVRGKIAVKGKGEMVTYLLEREIGGLGPGSPSMNAAAGALALAGPGGGEAMDREAFLTSPQFKKAMERYTTARNSFLSEEEELLKLLKSLDAPTANAAAVAAGLASGPASTPALPPPPAPGTPPTGGEEPAAGDGGPPLTAAEAVAAAGAIVPKLAVGLGTAAFKQMVLVGASASDLKALAVHMHAELAVSRAMMASAESEKAASIRADMLLKLYGRVLESPNMTLRDTFTCILDTLYKVIECDVIKLYVVDHARGQLWPASRHSAADQLLPLDGTLAGSAVRLARAVRVDDVATADEFNAELEELPAGYVSKSMMCVPVFSTASPRQLAQAQQEPLQGDVLAVVVAVNRWTAWDQAGGEEERRIVPFGAADESAVRDAAASVALLLTRRRGEMLLASAAGPAGLAGASFSVAALPASVARQRLRTVARRGSTVLMDTRVNLWAMKQEELMGQARDVVSALVRHTPGNMLRVLGDAGDEVLLSYLVRISGEQCGGTYFNLAHSISVLQGLYLTIRTHSELAHALGPHQLLALVLAATLLNVAREGEPLSLAAQQPPALGGGAPAVRGSARLRLHAAAAAAAALAVAQEGVASQAMSSGPISPTPTLSLPAVSVRGGRRGSEPGKPTSASGGAEALIRNGSSLRGGALLTSAADGSGPDSESGGALGGDRTSGGSRPSNGSRASRSGLEQISEKELLGAAEGAEAGLGMGMGRGPRMRQSEGGRGRTGQVTEEGECGVEDEDSRPIGPMRGPTASSLLSMRRAAFAPPGIASAGSGASLGPGSGPPSAAPSFGRALGATGLTGPGSGASTPGASFARGRHMSARRSRLASVVDDILSGESNLLASLPPAEASAVRASVVSLLALRSQPVAVLAAQGLQPARSLVAAVVAAAAAAAAKGDAAAAGAGGAPASRLSSGGGGAAEANGGNGAFGTANGVVAATAAAVAGPAAGPNGVRAGGSKGGAGAAEAANGVVDRGSGGSGSGEGGAAGESVSPPKTGDSLEAEGEGGQADTASGGPSKGGPLSLASLVQAAGTDPTKLGELRSAVSGLLLLTWSETLHTKDTATALSLLLSRAADVRKWTSRLGGQASSRRRSIVMLTGSEDCYDDVSSLLLLEVPRLQLEVIPLWQRASDLLPGLASQLEQLQANRAAYVTMLQSSATLSPADSMGHMLITPAGSIRVAPSGRGSMLRANPSGFVGVREPRRFISVKQRVSPSGSTTAHAGGDGEAEHVGMGTGAPGAGRVVHYGRRGSVPRASRAYMRVSSSRSYGTREDYGPIDDDEPEEPGQRLSAPSPGGRAAAVGLAAAAAGIASPRPGGAAAAVAASAGMSTGSLRRHSGGTPQVPGGAGHRVSGVQGYVPGPPAQQPSPPGTAAAAGSGGGALPNRLSGGVTDPPGSPRGIADVANRRGSITNRINDFFTGFKSASRRYTRQAGDSAIAAAAVAATSAVPPPPAGAVVVDIPSTGSRPPSENYPYGIMDNPGTPVAPLSPGLSNYPSQRLSNTGSAITSLPLMSTAHSPLMTSPVASFHHTGASTGTNAGVSGGAYSPTLAGAQSAGVAPSAGSLPAGTHAHVHPHPHPHGSHGSHAVHVHGTAHGGDLLPAGRGLRHSISHQPRLRARIMKKLSTMTAKLSGGTAGGTAGHVSSSSATPAVSAPSGAPSAHSGGSVIGISVVAGAQRLGASIHASPAASDGGGPASTSTLPSPGVSQYQRHLSGALPSTPLEPSTLSRSSILAPGSSPGPAGLVASSPNSMLPMPPMQLASPGQPQSVSGPLLTATSPGPAAGGPAAGVPVGSLALAQHHAEYAAQVAAAAAAFAASQAAGKDGRSRSAVVPGAGAGGPGGGGGTDFEAASAHSALSLGAGVGVGPGGMLSPVAELSNSGRNSSAAGTPRMGSLNHDPTAAPAAAHSAAPTAAPSRLGSVARNPVESRGGSQTLPHPPALGTAPTGLVIAEGAAVAAARTGLSPASMRDSSAEATGGKGGGTASKGVWLGLRLATEALRGVARDPHHAGAGAALGDPPTPAASHGAYVPPSAPHGAAYAGHDASPNPPAQGAGYAYGPGPGPGPAPNVLGRNSSTRVGPTPGAAAGVAGSSQSSRPGSRPTSRLHTPQTSLRRNPPVPGTGGVASLQAVLEMAEAALRGGSGGPGAGPGPGLGPGYWGESGDSQRPGRVSVGGGGAGLGSSQYRSQSRRSNGPASNSRMYESALEGPFSSLPVALPVQTTDEGDSGQEQRERVSAPDGRTVTAMRALRQSLNSRRAPADMGTSSPARPV